MRTSPFFHTVSMLITLSFLATACTKEDPLPPAGPSPAPVGPTAQPGDQVSKEPREVALADRHPRKVLHYAEYVNGLVSMSTHQSDERVSVTMIPANAAYTPLPPPDQRLDGHLPQ